MSRDLGAWFAQESWALAWERRAALVEPLVPHLLQELHPQPGERLLDIGTGIAPAAIAAYRQVQPGGTVTAVDVSDAVLAIARRRAANAGAAIDFHRLDAGRDDAPGAPFDCAFSMLGVMFFPDPANAFRHIARQLRPGGRLAFACWAEPAANPLLAETLLAPFIPDTTSSDAGHMGSFSLSSALAIETALAGSFERVHVRRLVLSLPVTPGDVFDSQLLDLYQVPATARPDALAHVARKLARHTGAAGLRAPVALNIATAIAPLG